MSANIKSRMTPGDVHFVVDRSERTLKAFSDHGVLLFAFPALAWGQHENWRAPNGDTPPGLYKCGVIYTTTGEAPYGPFCIDLVDLENQETGNGRAGISLHGGGSGCPDPFADFQPLLPTHGCVRVHNAHLSQKIKPLVASKQLAGSTVYVSVQE